MTKEGLAVNATFLVAEVRKEMAGSENGECQRSPTHHVLALESAKFKTVLTMLQVVSRRAKARPDPFSIQDSKCDHRFSFYATY